MPQILRQLEHLLALHHPRTYLMWQLVRLLTEKR